MIHLYTWTTPNGRKISMALEEMGVPYKVHPIDLGKNEQFSAEFLKIAPNNKIPAIVDDEVKHAGSGLAIFESAAILIYLAEKYGKLLPKSGPGRFKTLEWLEWQIGGVGPIFGQLGFFAVRAEEKVPLAINRFTEECDRLLGVMDRHLSKNRFFAGDEFTIAECAIYPWVEATDSYLKEPLAKLVSEKPSVMRWLKEVGARPATQRGMQVPKVESAA